MVKISVIFTFTTFMAAVFPFHYLPEMKWFVCTSLPGEVYWALDFSLPSGLAISALWWAQNRHDLVDPPALSCCPSGNHSLLQLSLKHMWNRTSVLWNLYLFICFWTNFPLVHHIKSFYWCQLLMRPLGGDDEHHNDPWKLTLVCIFSEQKPLCRPVETYNYHPQL